MDNQAHWPPTGEDSGLSLNTEASMPDGANTRGPSVALVHDYLLVMRGAERTFATIGDCFPTLPALLDRPAAFQLLFDNRPVRPTFVCWASRFVHGSGG